MRIAIDVTPIENNASLHKVRGAGFYIENLKKSLLQYFPDNEYNFFVRGNNLTGKINLIHYPYFEPFFLTLPIVNKYKTIVTVHDLTPLVFPKYFQPGIKGRIKWTFQKMALKKADAVITDSESSKKDISKYTGISEEKIYVIYLAAGEEFKEYEVSSIKYKVLKEKYNLPGKFALYVGDVTWNKNLPTLIEAVKKVDVPLVMVGKALVNSNYDKSNPWNQHLVKVQELVKNSKNVKCLGFVPTEDLVSLYNMATVFVMPSIYEGFGLPVLEAMNCGCPVVTAKGGSLPEIVGDAGNYVDAYSLESIAKGIKDVFNNKNLQEELSKKGLIQAKKFSWRKTAEETIMVYEEVCKVKSL